MGLYLDYNASAPIDPRVLDYMIDVYRNSVGNADSRTHDYGDAARRIVEQARHSVADILGIKSDEVIFTSGSTESNNIVIQGLKSYGIESGKKHVITTSIEHKAVLESAKSLIRDGFEVSFVEPDSTGRVSAEKIINLIRDDTLLVSVMHVNNETGIIQPVIEIGEYLQDKDVFFHVDATQSFGKLVDDLKDLKYDMLSMSAHKIYGPQGVGALVLRKKRYRFPPVQGIMYGGQQEHGIRPGTMPVALIAGLGKACSIAESEYKENEKKCKEIKNSLIEILDRTGANYTIIGNQDYCVSSTLNVSFSGVSAEALMIATRQYAAVSNGSACNSNSYNPSYVLTAMKIPDAIIDGAIRISWGPLVNKDECIDSMQLLINAAKSIAF